LYDARPFPNLLIIHNNPTRRTGRAFSISRLRQLSRVSPSRGKQKGKRDSFAHRLVVLCTAGNAWFIDEVARVR